jgi:tetratricopeptide (TPR) repeat protein
LHEDVGRAIEALYAASLDEHLPALAHHYSRSTNQQKAAKYLSLAGKQAMARGALQQAVQNLESALALVKAFPEGQVKDALELEVLSPLGTAYIATRGYAAPQVGPVFHRARELCNRIGGPQEQFAVVWGNFAWRIVRGEMDLSLELAQEALDRAESMNDPGVWMEALFLMGVTLFYRGDFLGALKQYEAALAHYDDDAERTRLWAVRVGEHAGVTHRCYLALTLWHLGRAEQALAVNGEMLALARSIEHPFSLAYALHHTSWLYHNLRLPAELLAASEEQMRFAADQGFPLFHATGIIYQAGALLLRGEPKTALPTLARGLDAYRGTGASLALPYYFGLLGSALNGCGRTSDADGALNEALSVVAASEERCLEAELHRLAGDLAVTKGEEAGVAEGGYRHALDIARKQNSKAWELRAATSLAQLLAKQDRRQEAHQTLSGCLGGFTEGLATPDIRDAQALLATLQTG